MLAVEKATSEASGRLWELVSDLVAGKLGEREASAELDESMEAPLEIIFEVTEAAEGGFDARALGHSIFTQGEDWADLKAMVRDAVLCHFGDRGRQRIVRLHFVKDEAIAV